MPCCRDAVNAMICQSRCRSSEGYFGSGYRETWDGGESLRDLT
jgi:hypothetical protein